jgi:hypothetical protein
LESTIWLPLVERYPVELTGVETGVGEGVAEGFGVAVGVGTGVAVGFGTGVGVAVGFGVAVGVGVGVGCGVDPPVVRTKPVGGIFTFPGLPMKPKEALPPGGIELCQE